MGNERTIKEIEDKANELWPDATIEVQAGTPIRLTVHAMYEAPGLSFAILRELADFCGTDDISDDRFSESGCETCDYGSRYGFTLTIGKRGSR